MPDIQEKVQKILDCVSCRGVVVVGVIESDEPPSFSDVELISKSCTCTNQWFNWRLLKVWDIGEEGFWDAQV